MTWIISLTQLVTTSKARQQKGVNLVVKLVTSTMDIEGEAAKLHKKIEKLKWQKDNEVLSKNRKDKKQDQIEDHKKHIKSFESKLTMLQVT